MSYQTGRYHVIRNTFDFSVIDMQDNHKEVLRTRDRNRAWREARKRNKKES